MGVAMLVLLQPLVAERPALAGQFGQCHPGACHLHLSLCGDYRARTAGPSQPRIGAGGDGPWAPTNGAPSADILLPQLKPSIIAGALISFTLSLDDFVITYFTAGPESITLPVKINSMVRFSVTPEVNAASTVLIVITVMAVLLAMKFQKRKPNR